jgi:hypothetical protein
MNKSEEIELRHKFEANCRHDGLSTAMTALAKYVDPSVNSMWKSIRNRGLINSIENEWSLSNQIRAGELISVGFIQGSKEFNIAIGRNIGLKNDKAEN